jgi:hypothetical protein
MTYLPVIKTVFSAYLYLWEERHYLWQLTLPPLVVLAILEALVQWGTISTVQTGNQMTLVDLHQSGWVAILFYFTFFLNIWIWLSYSVAWHRGYLVRGESRDVLKAYTWNGRQVQFLWTMIKIFFFFIPVIFIVQRFLNVGTGGLFILIFCIMACIYVYARLLLWFPAVAVDKNLNLLSLWQLSSKNGWRLVGVIAFTSLPLIILSLPIVFIIRQMGYFGHSHHSLSLALMGNLFFEFLSFLALAASISALSISYKFFEDNINS